jgi:hypothetical protein
MRTSTRSIEVLALLGVALTACVAAEPRVEPAAAPAAPAPPKGDPVRFEFRALGGGVLTSGSLAGRFTLLGFAATYDTASQAEAQFLASTARGHTPRVNVALLVLEPEDNAPMVRAFVDALHLTYPVAFADAATIAGRGPFADLHHVPSVVLLDREGREVWRRVGLATRDELDAALRDAEVQEKARARR